MCREPPPPPLHVSQVPVPLISPDINRLCVRTKQGVFRRSLNVMENSGSGEICSVFGLILVRIIAVKGARSYPLTVQLGSGLPVNRSSASAGVAKRIAPQNGIKNLFMVALHLLPESSIHQNAMRQHNLIAVAAARKRLGDEGPDTRPAPAVFTSLAVFHIFLRDERLLTTLCSSR